MIAFIVFLLSTLSFASEWADFAKKPQVSDIDGISFYEIETAPELAWFSKEVALGNTKINGILKNDLVLWDSLTADTNNWNRIGLSKEFPFEGIFDGNNHVIRGVHSMRDERNADSLVNGFFGYVGPSGIVKNLSLENALITTSYKGSDTTYNVSEADTIAMFYSIAGGIVGYNEGLIENISFMDGSVVPSGSSNIMGGASTGNVYIVNYIAGNIAGVNKGTIRNFRTNSPLNVKNAGASSLSYNIGYVGGVAGKNTGLIETGENEALTSLPNIGYVGGIAGWNEGEIENVHNAGSVINYEGFSGGIAAWNSGNITFATVTASIGGSTAGYGPNVGGVVAYNNGSIKNSGFFQRKDKNYSITARANGMTMNDIVIIVPEGNIGGLAAVQGPLGTIENCGAAVWYLGITASDKRTKIYSAGLVGLDSGSVSHSYSANRTQAKYGVYKPLYTIVDSSKIHAFNYYDSSYSSEKYDSKDGLDSSLMRSAKFAWQLNTKMGTVANQGIWTYYDWYPEIANKGEKPSYRVVRYVGNDIFDTVYTNYLGHAFWNENVPDDGKGNTLSSWELRSGSVTQKITSQHVFSSDTSVFAVMEPKENVYFTVTFLAYNDTVLQKEKVAYGTLPEYSGADLFRDSTGSTYRYSFKGWDHPITEVVYDQVYKAVYSSSTRSYKVDFKAICGNRLMYGSSNNWIVYRPERDYCDKFNLSTASYSTDTYDCKFTGWNVNCRDMELISDTTIYAMFDSIPKSSSSNIDELSSSSVESSSSAESSSSSEDKGSSSSKEDSSSSAMSSSSSEKANVLPIVKSNPLNLRVSNRTVEIAGATSADAILLDLQGNVIDRTRVNDQKAVLQAPSHGLYIVRCGTDFYKLRLK